MWIKVYQVSFVQPGRGCSSSATFQIFDMPNHSGDIRHQSRKLSEIAPKFGRFLALPNFRGRAFQKLYARYHLSSRHVGWKSLMRIFPLARKLYGCIRWILSQILNFDYYNFFWGGSPVPVGMCDSKAWLISSACKNLWAQHPLRIKILCPEKCLLGWVNMHLYNFFVCWPKFTRFLLSNVGGVLVDKLRFRFLMCRPIPKIFAIKIEYCQKSRRNLDVFWLSQILGGGPSESCTHVITPALRHVDWKKFHKNIPTSPKVIGVHTLNFKPNF